MTSQGESISLEIAGGVLTQITFTVTVTGNGWAARSEQTYSIAVPVENRWFQTQMSGDGWDVTVTALSDGHGQMVGVIHAEHYYPQGMGNGSARVTFEARQEAEK